MDIVKLPIGQSPSPDTDCIKIQQLPDGQFRLYGTVLLACGDAETAESVSLIGGELYASYEDAESAGLAWANEHCVATLNVGQSDGTAPLPEPA